MYEKRHQKNIKVTTVLGNGKEDDLPPLLTNFVVWYLLKIFLKRRANFSWASVWKSGKLPC